MSYISRLYNHRNAQSMESINDKPFFSKQHDSSGTHSKGGFFQTKLAINKPGDQYEKEADNVATSVVSNKNASPILQQKNISSIQKLATTSEEEKVSTNDQRMDRDKEKPFQRKAAEPEKNKLKGIQKMDNPLKEEKKKKTTAVQTKQDGTASTASTQVTSKINNSSGKGNPLPKNTLHEMGSSFGADFSNVNVHHDSESVDMNKELNAQAFTHGSDIYFNEGKYDPASSAGKFLLAHELTHVIQQRGLDEKVQRDLAIEPSNPDVAEPILTPDGIRNAIIFNNERYGQSSVRLIQDIVGATVTGTMNDETIRLIALFQAQNGLKADGMVGPNTFDQMTSELAAEGVSQDTCLNMFNVGVVSPMEIHAGAAPNTANIFGHFDVEIRFSPHCDCSRFEYRQFISGSVTLNGTSLNNQFSIPPGNVLPAVGNFIEDGNTTLPNNGRFGHRNLPASQGILNQYTDSTNSIDMDNGCKFRSFDEPGVIGAPANTGDIYVFDFRFFGDIRKDGQMIERKFWSVRETITIP